MSQPLGSMHVKRITLTSKKNWWMVEMNEDEDSKPSATANSFSSEDTAVSQAPSHHPSHAQIHAGPVHASVSVSQPYADVDPGSRTPSPSPHASPHVFRPPDRHPAAIFSFPTPTTYAAPPNPTAHLAPYATGSTAELFKCVVKKPDVVQLEINGEMQSNASDVTTQFLAELRVYTTVERHRNIVGFLGCLEGVGMVLEFIDGRTLLDAIRARPPLTPTQKIDYHNQLLDGLSHLHSYGLSHGDLSLLNVHVTHTNTLKILDFGRSVAADSFYDPPEALPADPFEFIVMARAAAHENAHGHGHGWRAKRMQHAHAQPSHGFGAFGALPRKVEQIHRGTRPFTAPEILRGECQDARLADAYSFGVVLVCLDLCVLVDAEPEEQARDVVPPHFVEGCATFRERIAWYLQPWDRRRRLDRADMIRERHWWDEE